MSPRVRDLLASTLAIVALVSALMLVDQRVRGRVGGVATEIVERGWSPPAAVDRVMGARWMQYGGNVYLVVFLFAGVALVCLMLRT